MARGFLHGYPASAGGKVICVGIMTGPTSYGIPPGFTPPISYTGQLFTDSAARSIDYLEGSVTRSGTYRVMAGSPQLGGNPNRWIFRWIVIASGVEAAAGTNLSGETFHFFATYS
jgi:hypothetical protein